MSNLARLRAPGYLIESSIILEFVIQIAYVGSTTDMITGCG